MLTPIVPTGPHDAGEPAGRVASLGTQTGICAVESICACYIPTDRERTWGQVRLVACDRLGELDHALVHLGPFDHRSLEQPTAPASSQRAVGAKIR